jgi:SPP1 family predicted phage head-tail adaptor
MPHFIAENLRAGDLNKRVTLQAPTYNPSGDEITGYDDVLTASASIEPIRGRELVESQRDISEEWTRIRIRYRAGLDVVKRVVHGETEYDVDSVINPQSSNRVLELMCRAIR